ncbi:hypothetical protein, partial [Akkermansia muciniphila]|uniref:hypothetical protein n=1 Tax=Akkermansia muciniphila TaxID=239935 RepID=UPI00195FC67E
MALVDELFFTQCTRGLLKSQIAPAWHFRALVHSGALCLIFCRDVLKGKGYFYAEKVDRDQYIGLTGISHWTQLLILWAAGGHERQWTEYVHPHHRY